MIEISSPENHQHSPSHPLLRKDYTSATLPSTQIANRVLYDGTTSNYFVLYGCDSCIEQVKQQQKLV